MFDYIKNLLSSESESRSYIRIPSDRVADAPELTGFETGKCYLALWLTDMHLTHKRVLYQNRVPAVHSYCRFLYDGEQKEVPKVVGIGQIDGMGRALDRIIDLNHPLFGPAPFNGGRVDIVLALVSIEVQDYGQDLLNLLSDLSALGAEGELKLVSPVLEPLKKGVDKLFGLGKVNPHLAIYDSLEAEDSAPHPLEPGYYAVIDAAPGEYRNEHFWIRQGVLHYGQKLQTASAFDAADYFVFYIENRASRQDWSSLRSIDHAWWSAVKTAGRNSDDAEREMTFQAFKNVVLESPDLIWNDKVALIRKLRSRMKDAAELGSHRGFRPARPIGLSIDDVMDEETDTETGEVATRDELIALRL